MVIFCFQNIEKNSKLNWNLKSTVTGTTTVSLPSSFSEIQCKIRVTNSDQGINYYTTIRLLDIEIPYDSEGAQRFYSGAYINSKNTYGVMINICRSNVQLLIAYVNGTDVTSTAVMDVRYR